MANEVRINVTSRDRSGPGFKSARQNADQLGNSTRRVGEIAAGILASQVFQRIATAAIRAFTDTIRAASNLNESVNAVQVVFGDAADSVMAIGESSAQSMGLSQRAFNEAAVRFSAFADTIAGDGGDVAQVVEDVTGRASDFASVMNIDVAQAMSLFQSGLAGQSEPLRRYGIDISAAATNAFAWANGIAEAGQELSEQEKVQARYGLIMEQTAATQGDFANTSNDMANAQRILSAELEDLQAQMGTALLPVLGELFSFLTDVVTGFGELPGSVQGTISVLAALIPVAGAAAAAMRLLGISFQMLKTAAPWIAGALAIGGAIIVGLKALGANADQAARDVDGLAAAIRNADLAEIARQLESEGVLEKTEALGLSVEDVVNAFAEGGPKLDDFRTRIAAIAAEYELVASPTGTTTKQFTDQALVAQELLLILDDLDRGLISVGEAQRRMAVATEETVDVISEEAAKAAEAWGEAVADIAGGNEILKQANDDLAENEELTTARIIEAGRKRVKAQVEHTDNVQAVRERASEDVRDLMVEEAQEFPELAALARDATEDEWAAWEDIYRDKIAAANRAANQELVANTPELAAIAENAGAEAALKIAAALRDGGPLTVAEAKNIFDGVEAEFHDDIFQLISPQLNAEALRQVEIAINGVARPRTVSLRMQTFGAQGIGGQIPGRAHGGITGAHDMGGVLVGERVPEVIDPAPGSRITPTLDQATDRNQAGGTDDRAVRLELDFVGADDAFVEFFRKIIRVRGESLVGS